MTISARELRSLWEASVIESDALAQGRAAFSRRAWGDAFERLSAADRENPLPAEDLEQLAVAAYLVGRDADCDDATTRAHVRWLDSGNVQRAVRCAFWARIRPIEPR